MSKTSQGLGLSEFESHYTTELPRPIIVILILSLLAGIFSLTLALFDARYNASERLSDTERDKQHECIIHLLLEDVSNDDKDQELDTSTCPKEIIP